MWLCRICKRGGLLYKSRTCVSGHALLLRPENFHFFFYLMVIPNSYVQNNKSIEMLLLITTPILFLLFIILFVVRECQLSDANSPLFFFGNFHA